LFLHAFSGADPGIAEIGRTPRHVPQFFRADRAPTFQQSSDFLLKFVDLFLLKRCLPILSKAPNQSPHLQALVRRF
jgi:hypothetical protein